MALLEITKTENGFFLFESNNQKHGCLTPQANITRNRYIRFRTFFGENIEAEIPWEDVIINGDDTFTSIEDVMDKLKELGFASN